MTGRFCEVHGEYAPTGTCRWCEPAPANTWEADHSGPTRCRCGKYAWAPGAAELNYVDPDRMAHSPEQCFKLDAEAPPSPTFTFAGEDATAVRWTLDFTPAICPEDLIAARNAELAAQHAALRWERVARRWAGKHPSPWKKLDPADMDAFTRRMVDAFLRWFYGLEPKP
jgi:hypothetical protein